MGSQKKEAGLYSENLVTSEDYFNLLIFLLRNILNISVCKQLLLPFCYMSPLFHPRAKCAFSFCAQKSWTKLAGPTF